LELHDRGELKAAGSAATEERVADSHVTGRAQRVVPAVAAGRGIGRSDVGDEVRQERIREVRVVEQVEELSPELQVDLLGQSRIFEEREVELLEAGPSQRIASQVAEMASAGDAIRFIGSAVVRKIAPGARSGEGTEIQVLQRVAEVVLNGTDHIRTIV